MWKETVDSTNNECRRLIESLDNLSYIAAYCQTAGRGQGDHTWTSTPGQNLTFSYVVKPESLSAMEEIFISRATALGIVEYLRGKGIQARIKLPNDIWVADKKICGILIEVGLKGSMVDWSIIGVGLNLNQTDFPAFLPNPTSVAVLTGKQYNLEEEMELLHKEICRHVEMISSLSGRDYLQTEFDRISFKLSE